VDFAAVLADLAQFLDRNHLRFGLAGALALHAHGLSRATSDLDLVVEDKAKPLLLEHLDGLGYERLHASDGFSNHLHRLPDAPPPGLTRARSGVTSTAGDWGTGSMSSKTPLSFPPPPPRTWLPCASRRAGRAR
jgi:hypothetical protein